MQKKQNTKNFISDLKKLLKKYNANIYIDVSSRPKQKSDDDNIIYANIDDISTIDFGSNSVDKNCVITGINYE
jgi:hypothetical protein